MNLTFYICGSSIVLRIQRVELLIEPMLGGDPGVDGAADRLDRSWLHDRASAADLSSWRCRRGHGQHRQLRGQVAREHMARERDLAELSGREGDFLPERVQPCSFPCPILLVAKN